MGVQYLYDLKDNWNSGGTDFTAFGMQVTDAASGAGSKLIDFQVNGNQMFTVDKLGNLKLAGDIDIGGTVKLAQPLPIASGGTGAKTKEEARTNLGLKALATKDKVGDGDFADEALGIAHGGTGAKTVDKAREAFVVDKVDNTPDVDKPVSTAQAAAISAARDSRVALNGDRMKGSLSSAVIDLGTLNTGTYEIPYAPGNTYQCKLAGDVTFNPTGLAPGAVLQINFDLQSGASVGASGTTQWSLGAGAVSNNIADVGVALASGVSYVIIFEIRAGRRTGVFTA